MFFQKKIYSFKINFPKRLIFSINNRIIELPLRLILMPAQRLALVPKVGNSQWLLLGKLCRVKTLSLFARLVGWFCLREAGNNQQEVTHG